MGRTMRFTLLPVVAVCLGSLLVAGCGPSGMPKTVKAKFKAQYKNGTAVQPMVVLSLHPEKTGEKYTVGAQYDNGEYVMKTTVDSTSVDGAPPGTYKVTVQGGMAPPGGKVDKPTAECADPAKTPLKIEVTDSGEVKPNPLEIPLAE